MFANIFTSNKQENFSTLTCDSVKVVENFIHVKILSVHAQVQIKRRIGLYSNRCLKMNHGRFTPSGRLIQPYPTLSCYLWPPCIADADIIFLPCSFFLSSSFLFLA